MKNNKLSKFEVLQISSFLGFFYGIAIYIAIMFGLSFKIEINDIDIVNQTTILGLCFILGTAGCFYFIGFEK